MTEAPELHDLTELFEGSGIGGVVSGEDVMDANSRRFAVEAAMAAFGVQDKILDGRERAELLRYAASLYRFLKTGETATGELVEV